MTKATLTVGGVNAVDKTYDRTTAATLTGTASLAGILGSDSVSLGGTPTASFADKTVANNKPVTISGYTISGTDAGNYTLTQPTSTATITAKPLTVTGITAAGRTYDATTSATVDTSAAALVGVIGADAVTLGTGSAAGAFLTKTAAPNKTVQVSGLTISGADSANYSLTQPTATATIAAKNLTVSGVTAQDKVYDRSTSATVGTGSASLVGVVSGDAAALDTSSVTGTFANDSVGAGKTVTVSGVGLSGADAPNYTVTQPTATAAITAMALAVSGAVAQDKPYDGTTTAAVDFGGASLTGIVSGDTVTLVTTGYSANFATASAGSGIAVTVAGATVGGADAGNYSLTQPVLSADITGAPLTITGVYGSGQGVRPDDGGDAERGWRDRERCGRR